MKKIIQEALLFSSYPDYFYKESTIKYKYNMKYSLIIIIYLFLASSISILAQEINQTDAQGLKQGLWKKNYPNGKPMYEATFKDNKPVDVMYRYYENGEKRAIMNFRTNSEIVHVVQFYENGKKSAEGNFINLKKDSIWNFYSFHDGGILSTETYNSGMKNGIQKTFFANGNLSSEIEYKNDIKDGIWNEFFEDGKRKSEANYKFNMLYGKYAVFQPTGKLLALGFFVDDKRHGTWKFFKPDGTLKYEIKYHYGRAENDEILEKQDEEFFKMVDENIGKFEEPSIEDFFPGGGR